MSIIIGPFDIPIIKSPLFDLIYNLYIGYQSHPTLHNDWLALFTKNYSYNRHSHPTRDQSYQNVTEKFLEPSATECFLAHNVIICDPFPSWIPKSDSFSP